MQFQGNLWVPLSEHDALQVLRPHGSFEGGFGGFPGEGARGEIVGYLSKDDAIAQGRVRFPEADFAVVHVQSLPVILLDGHYAVKSAVVCKRETCKVVIAQAGVEMIAGRIRDDRFPHWQLSMQVYGPAERH